MTGRYLSAEERALWRAAMRDVTRSVAEVSPHLPDAVPTAAPRRAHPARAAAASPGDAALAAAPGLDRRSAETLRRGERTIEARLDLHGMTQEEAHRALDAFVARAADGGKRCVLVITGKSGVLHGAVPRWLGEAPNRGRLLAFSPAQPRHGGAGALYLLLRRRR
jgi:DNA-nicking Smr family endonuclease